MVSVLRPGQRILNIPGFGVTTSRRAVSVGGAGVDWSQWFTYLWIFKGAASQVASYTDVISGQVLSLGTAPTWNSTDGLIFSAAGGTYLKTGVTPTMTWTGIIRLSGVSGADQWAFGNYNASGWGIQPNSSDSSPQGTVYYNGSYSIVASHRTSGVWALSGSQGYYDGSSDGAATSGSASLGDECWLGDISGPYRRNITANCQVFGLRNSTLDATGVSAASAAMAAL